MAQSLAQSERQALCNLLEERGPLAPTLCEGWTTSDLAAHLFVRDSRPLALPGILLKAFAGVTEREMERAKRELGYGGLIRRIRSGPPLPIRIVDSQVNLLEYFVHHEDLRRSDSGWEPRQDPALDAGLWAALRRGARLMARRLHGAGLELAAPDFGSVVAREGAPLARVSASPQELVLLMFGRGKVARVEVEGPDAARAALDAANFRI